MPPTRLMSARSFSKSTNGKKYFRFKPRSYSFSGRRFELRADDANADSQEVAQAAGWDQEMGRHKEGRISGWALRLGSWPYRSAGAGLVACILCAGSGNSHVNTTRTPRAKSPSKSCRRSIASATSVTCISSRHSSGPQAAMVSVTSDNGSDVRP